MKRLTNRPNYTSRERVTKYFNVNRELSQICTNFHRIIYQDFPALEEQALINSRFEKFWVKLFEMNSLKEVTRYLIYQCGTFLKKYFVTLHFLCLCDINKLLAKLPISDA